jgi:hypothetical protein
MLTLVLIVLAATAGATGIAFLALKAVCDNLLR